MITYQQLGNNGRLGNGLFQIASCLGLSHRYGTKAVFPKWAYSQYFKFPDVEFSDFVPVNTTINEPHFHYAGDFFDSQSELFRNMSVNISGDGNTTGYLQSYKYFDKELTLRNFAFNEHFKDVLLLRFMNAFNKPTIAISIRIGDDYIKNGNYVILPINYYITALMENFKNWRDYNLVIFSDNLEYAKLHFGCLPNAYFAEGLSDVEQLCLGAQCDHFIISNSTFAWWMAYLRKNQTGKVIRPNYYFQSTLFKENKIKDFFPTEWINFEHTECKIDLKDVTFTVPVHYDHSDRLENFMLSLSVLDKCFDTNFIVCEQGSHQFNDKLPLENFRYIQPDSHLFHRTAFLNWMAKISETSIVVNYDCDVLIPPMQIFEAVTKIRNGEADFVYPYDGRFARVPRVPWLRKIQNYMDIGFFSGIHFRGMEANATKSLGGCVICNKGKFFEAGGENENYISYGNEDVERNHRWRLLGYRVERIEGVLYHLDHYISANSSTTHPNFIDNAKEWNKIRKMSPDELRNYVDSWHKY